MSKIKKTPKKCLKKAVALSSAVVVILMACLVPCSATTSYSEIPRERNPVNISQFMVRTPVYDGSKLEYNPYWSDVTPTSYTTGTNVYDFKSEDMYNVQGIQFGYEYSPRVRTLTDWNTNPSEEFDAFEYQYVFAPKSFGAYTGSVDRIGYITSLSYGNFFCTINPDLYWSDASYRFGVYYKINDERYVDRLYGEIAYDVIYPVATYDESSEEYAISLDVIDHVEKSWDINGGTYTAYIIERGDFQLPESDIIEEDFPVIITNVSVTCNIYVRNFIDSSNVEHDVFSCPLIINISMPRSADLYSFSLEELTGTYMAFTPSTTEIISISDISVVDWVITQVNGVLALEIMPNVTIGGILWVVIGLSLVFVVMKLFLGG